MVPQLARLNPFIAPLASRILRAGDGVKVDELQPEETEEFPPAAILDGQLERVTATDEMSNLQYHVNAIAATSFTHAPVLRMSVTNALVSRNGFATARHKQQFSRALLSDATRLSEVGVVDSLRFCTNYVAWRYFGHWLADGIPMTMIDGADQGRVWLPWNGPSRHVRAYQQLFDLPEAKANLIFARNLTFYQDFGQGSHKRRRYAALRDRVRRTFGGQDQGSDNVFIARGNTGVARVIVDEARLKERLAARGWIVIDIATSTVEELQKAICRARVIVGIEGSHLYHAHLSMRRESVMVVLLPNDRFTSLPVGICNANRVSAGFVVLEGSREQGYRVNWDEVERTIDLASTRAARLPTDS